MNKKILIGLLLVIILSLGLVSTPAEAEIGGSVTAVTPGNVSEGATVDFTFTVGVSSPDLEYFSRFNVTLPAEWTINTVAAPPPLDSFCTATSPSSGNTGQTAWWGEDPDSCGPWDGASYDFSVNVTIDSCANAPWDLPWLIEGDGWGAVPHTVNGTYSSVTCTPAGGGGGSSVPLVAYDKINQVRVTAPGTPLYESAGGNVVRSSGGSEIWVPNASAHNAYEDVYDVTDSIEIDGTTWVEIFIGSATVYVWIPVGPNVQLIN